MGLFKLTGILFLAQFFSFVYGSAHPNNDPETRGLDVNLNRQQVHLASLLGPIDSLLGYVFAMGKIAGGVLESLAGDNPGQGDYRGGQCADVMVIFARGTTQSGTIGGTVGPAFLNSTLNALAQAIPPMNLSFTGVPYPAAMEDFFEGGSKNGSITMASMLEQAALKCPDSAIISTGYSQGGQVVHNSARILAQYHPEAFKHIKAFVIFGDPDSQQTLPSQVPPYSIDTVCHSGDAVCGSAAKHVGYRSSPELGLLLKAPFIGLTLPQHLNYQKETDDAAQFIIRALKPSSGPVVHV
ncbi:Cutinase [Mycena indigotica]|uniref:cutinase n=1 Tax=Mycena indigotica TaxID=2126181 RepID=A0A8H6S3Q4_9AGAR|nr:Cutinase [Mycena indigotica]KAF7290755.1 Cutinase [Mycena indigotica]